MKTKLGCVGWWQRSQEFLLMLWFNCRNFGWLRLWEPVIHAAFRPVTPAMLSKHHLPGIHAPDWCKQIPPCTAGVSTTKLQHTCTQHTDYSAKRIICCNNISTGTLINSSLGKMHSHCNDLHWSLAKNSIQWILSAISSIEV